MSKFNSQLIIGAVLVILASGQALPQQTNQQSASDILEMRMRRLMDYQKDFIDFAKSNRNNSLEFQIATDFGGVARETYDHMDAASSLLFVYDNITSKSDRASVKRFIESKCRHYAKNIDLNIEVLNLGLSHTKNQGIAASGTRLKEELREIKALLQTINLVS